MLFNLLEILNFGNYICQNYVYSQKKKNKGKGRNFFFFIPQMPILESTAKQNKGN